MTLLTTRTSAREFLGHDHRLPDVKLATLGKAARWKKRRSPICLAAHRYSQHVGNFRVAQKYIATILTAQLRIISFPHRKSYGSSVFRISRFPAALLQHSPCGS